jgi:glycosyltransferase involved in cell wall biosynthesis
MVMSGVLIVSDGLDEAEQANLERLRDELMGRGVGVALAASGGRPRPGVIACPGLDRPLRRAWIVRRWTGADGLSAPELIHAVGLEMAPAALEMAERWERPYLLSVPDFPPIGTTLRVSRRWFRGAVVPAPDLAAELHREFGVPRDLIRVVPPAITPPPPRPDEGTASSSNRIAVIGTAVTPERFDGLAVFFRAARLILDSGHDVEFAVAWDRGEDVSLRRLAEPLGLSDRVTFAPGLLHNDAFWGVLDVYCHPALRPSVAHPLLAALAHGVPCVGSDVPGLRGWLAGDAGRLVAPGVPDLLAASLLDLIEHPFEARAPGKRGRASILERCPAEAEAETLETLYREIAAEVPETAATADLAAGD